MNYPEAEQYSLQTINRKARENAAAFVIGEEERYLRSIGDTARRIAAECPISRFILLSGPSSSGKTTTAHFLEQALRREGVNCVTVSLDDFYRGESMAPLLPDGRRDYECPEALDLPEIRRCARELSEQGRCEMPVFDFEQHVRYPHRRQVVLGERGIAVVEGIHGLNPELFGDLSSIRMHRVYISVNSAVSSGGTVLLSPDEIRLVRRIVRDHNFRETKPDETLFMWENVMNGERRYVAPYRECADVRIDSFHGYELCMLREQALSLLAAVPAGSPNRERAEHLAHALEQFEPVAVSLVPKDSMLREFIGDAGRS